MSNPVTNIEIEDVLSSIRRLVSEGDKLRPADSRVARDDPESGLSRLTEGYRSTSKTEPSAPPDSDRSEGGDRASGSDPDPAPPKAQSSAAASRFVLTPSLRVDDADDEPAASGGDRSAAEGPLVLTPLVLTSPRVAAHNADEAPTAADGDAAAGHDMPVGDTTIDTEEQAALPDPASGDPAAYHDDAAAPAHKGIGASSALFDALDDLAPTSDAGPAAPGAGAKSAEGAPGPASPSQTLEETIAELEAAVTHTSGDWEPDGSEEAPVVDWSEAAAQAGIFASRIRRPVLVADMVEDAEEVPQDTPFRHRRAMRADAHSSMQPDSEAEHEAETDAFRAAFDHAETASEAPERSAEAARDDRAASAEQAFGAMDAASLLGEDAILDEAALRELVAEIVREELQGKLGERITRNVRKLVRREIYRVISSESFD